MSQLDGYFTFIPKAVLEYVWKLVFVVADAVVFAAVVGCCASEGRGMDPGNSGNIVINSRASPDAIITRDIRLKVLWPMYISRKGYDIFLSRLILLN
jgi:hypothetical protein